MSKEAAASKRVQRDVRDFQKLLDSNEFESLGASAIRFESISDDVWNWQLFLTPNAGNYKGTEFCLNFKFGKDYPFAPPNVNFSRTYLGYQHPNVFFGGLGLFPSGYICLDMLKTLHGPWMGWSAAYTLHSCVMQLIGFLFVDDAIEQDYGGVYKRAPISQATLPSPGGVSQVPGVRQQVQVATQRIVSSAETLQQQVNPELPSELVGLIIGKASPETRGIIQQSIPELAEMANLGLIRDSLHCAYLKTPMEHCILGIGVDCQGRDGNRFVCAFDGLISYEAFELGVRRSIWNHEFKLFLPLYLNNQHGARALPLLHKLFPSRQRLLDMVCQLMNHTAVSMNYSAEDGKVTRNMSDTAITSFCYLHQLLLALANEPGSDLLGACQREVQEFVSSRSYRGKRACPDLGVLLVKYSLTPSSVISWEAFLPPFLQEVLSRQVLHVIKNLPEDQKSRFVSPDADEVGVPFDRLVVHFQNALTSLRLVMFQAWFSNGVARSEDADGFSKVLMQYNMNDGSPSLSLMEACNVNARKILRSSKWVDFFAGIHLGFNVDPRRVWTAVLRQAVVDSKRSGYHSHGKSIPTTTTFFPWGNQAILGNTQEPWCSVPAPAS